MVSEIFHMSYNVYGENYAYCLVVIKKLFTKYIKIHFQISPLLLFLITNRYFCILLSYPCALYTLFVFVKTFIHKIINSKKSNKKSKK